MYTVNFNPEDVSGSDPSQVNFTFPSDVLETVAPDAGVFKSAGKGA